MSHKASENPPLNSQYAPHILNSNTVPITHPTNAPVLPAIQPTEEPHPHDLDWRTTLKGLAEIQSQKHYTWKMGTDFLPLCLGGKDACMPFSTEAHFQKDRVQHSALETMLAIVVAWNKDLNPAHRSVTKEQETRLGGRTQYIFIRCTLSCYFVAYCRGRPEKNNSKRAASVLHYLLSNSQLSHYLDSFTTALYQNISPFVFLSWEKRPCGRNASLF